MRVPRLAVLLVLAGLAGAGRGEPVVIGEKRILRSTVMGEDRTILISLPNRYSRSTESYPVLYMTDGDGQFIHASGSVDVLGKNGLIPDLIIVGIQNTDRARDLTPTRSTNLQRDGTRVDVPTSGGADRFLEFFEKELFPYVEANFRTAPYRIFAGHSLGGLLALHAVMTRPQLFNAAIAASPHLAWDDDRILKQAEDFFKERKDFKKTLFLTMGDEEEGQPRPNRFDRLVKTLSKSKLSGLEWEAKQMPEETHGTVVLPTYYWGLRKVFEGWRLPVDKRTRVFMGSRPEVESHYAGLSKRLGYRVIPPEAAVNHVGYQALNVGDLERATAILRYNVELYPQSPNVHDSLGEALERQLRLDEALACYEKAIEKGRQADPQTLGIYIRNRDRVKAMRAGGGAR